MPSVNKVILIGNLGKDPELRYNTNGVAFCSLNIATSRKWKDRASGEQREETEWHKVVFNDKLAEIVGEYCKKGKPIYIEGRLRTRKWQDKEGRDNYVTEVMADQMQMLGVREDGERDGAQSQGRERQPAAARAPAPRPAAKTGTGFDDMDDDIPF